jgi:hypothetical protein
VEATLNVNAPEFTRNRTTSTAATSVA